MWKCEQCGEEHEDQFESCWNCAGQRSASDIPAPHVYEKELTLDEKLAEKFKCPKCRSKKAEIQKIAVTGTGISKILDIQHNTYISVSCQKCGFTEFYNADVLENPSTAGTIIDLLWG